MFHDKALANTRKDNANILNVERVEVLVTHSEGIDICFFTNVRPVEYNNSMNFKNGNEIKISVGDRYYAGTLEVNTKVDSVTDIFISSLIAKNVTRDFVLEYIPYEYENKVFPMVGDAEEILSQMAQFTLAPIVELTTSDVFDEESLEKSA